MADQNYIPTFEQLLRQYTTSLNQAHEERLRQLNELFGGLNAHQQGISRNQALGGQGTATPKWGNLQEMNAALAAKRQAELKEKKAREEAKPKRIAEIELELEIIRGRVPTPRGYTIHPAKVKALLKELGELKKS